MLLFQCLILKKKVEWRHTLFSFDVNEILFSSSYKKSEKFLENNLVRVATLKRDVSTGVSSLPKAR